MKPLLALLLCLGMATAAGAAVSSTTTHGPAGNSLDGMTAAGDLLSGLIGAEQPGDQGWHPANTDPLDKLPAFTDDAGVRPTGLTGLMNDFPPPGSPAKLVRYSLGGPKDIASIGILTGNNGKDGRVFSTTVIKYSTDGGSNFNTLGYFQSDLSGTINSGQWGSTHVSVFDNASSTLLAGVTDIQFDLYSVDNTGGELRDPFNGVNPFTGIDDTFSAAIASPLVFELDVVEVPEPATLGLLIFGGLLLGRRKA